MKTEEIKTIDHYMCYPYWANIHCFYKGEYCKHCEELVKVGTTVLEDSENE